MHNLVGSVFKVLGISLVMFIVLNTGLVVFDTISVHNKVVSLAAIMENEIARNNCVQNAILPTFESQLENVVENSDVAKEVNTNLSSKIIIDGKSYESIGEDNVGNYGDIKTLIIKVKMKPTRIKRVGEYNLTYTYNVPCLRYLK